VAVKRALPYIRAMDQNQRLHTLDVIRGFALLGILLMNIEYFQRPMQAIVFGMNTDQAGADLAVAWFSYAFVQGKFYTMFSLLFGLGFVVFLDRAMQRGASARTLFARRDGVMSVLAGLALAAHFGTWVPSVTLTSIATATALVATQPVWQGLIARLQGRRLPARVWLGIGLALIGAVAATGVDLTVSAQAVAGDVLALVGAVAAALYVAAGEQVRAATSTTTYTTVCYGVCALALGAVCVLARVPLTGYPVTAWLAIAGLVIGPQLLGHSMFSYALRRVSATTVSLLILLEVPGATLIGWLRLGQLPHPAAWPGLVLLVAGVAVTLRHLRDASPPPPPAG
jgi:drug/metabolite transporter (DMT)-like permease